MNKFIKLFLVLVCIGFSTSAFSQRDFDYTIYTDTKVSISYDDRKAQQTGQGYDTIHYTLDRRFTKNGGTLRQTSIYNTGGLDIEYKIEYVGYSNVKGIQMFGYRITSIDGKPEEDSIIYINPMLGKVIFVTGDYESVYE